MLLAKTFTTPTLVIIVFTLLLAKISSGQVREEYQRLDCSETSFEKDKTQIVLTRSTKRTDGKCTFFIKIQANRSIRMNFKCVTVNSTHSNSDCLQQINVSVLNNGTWETVQGTFSLNRDEKSFCITLKDVMINLNTKVSPYLKHWKVRYEVTENECEQDVPMKEPEAKSQLKKDEIYMLKETVRHRLVDDQVMATSLSTRSTKTLNFKTIPSEEHMEPKESSTNTRLLFPTPSQRSMHYHATQSTVPFNSLPITADFQNESSVGQRESIYGSLSRRKLKFDTGTSKEEKISNLFLSLQEYLAKSPSTPTRKLTSRLVASPFSKKGGKSTTRAKKSRIALLHLTEMNYSVSISEMTNAEKETNSFSVGPGQVIARKQHNTMTAKEHLKKADWSSEVKIQRSEVSFKTHKAKFPNLGPSPQLFYGLASKKHASSFEQTTPLISISSHSVRSTSSLSLKTTGARGDFQKRYHEKEQQSVEFARESRKLKVLSFSSQAMESKSLKSKAISGAFIENHSSHGYPVISGDINKEGNNIYLSYTKHLQSNLSTSSFLNSIEDSSIFGRLSLTKSRTKSQPARTVVNPTVSSVSEMLQWNYEVTQHRITQSSYESLNQYTTSFKPSNANRRSTAKGSSITTKNRDPVQEHRQLHPTRSDSLSSLRASGRRTGIAPSFLNTVYGSSSAVHGKFSTAHFTSLSSKQTPTFSSFAKGIPKDHLINSTQSMTDENAERTLPSLSVSSSYSDPIGYSSENEQSLEVPSAKYFSVIPSDYHKATELSYLIQTTAPLHNHLVSNQLKKKVKATLTPSLTFMKTQVASFSINESKRNILFTTKIIPSEMIEHKISDTSKSTEEVQINKIRPSITSLRNSQLLHISTKLRTGKDISLSYRRNGSPQIYSTSNFGHIQYSKASSMVTEVQTSSTFPRPTKSSGLSLKSSIKLKDLEDSCSYHFINNINGLEADDEMRFEVLDILSLKIKRIIAVSWPYDGYLGRAGFIHRGLVLQTMDGRLWYNHIQNKESHIFMVYLNGLQDLHRRIRIIYSHNISEDEDTLKEHVDVWGKQVGMYFRTCSKKERKN